jgi:chromosome segregation ATPase
MAKQSNSGPSDQTTPAAREITPGSGDQSDTVGQAILSVLDTAAEKAEADIRQALQTAERLSRQLRAAQDRIADLEAEVQFSREKLECAEGWLSRISSEIEDRLIYKPDETQQLH